MRSGSICIEAGPLKPTSTSLRKTQGERTTPRLNLQGAGPASLSRAGSHFPFQSASARCRFRLPSAFRPLFSGFCPGFRCFRWPPRVAGALMLPKRRRARVASPSSAPSSAARFPGVTIYLAEPHMGRSRRAFLTRLAVSKGFRVLSAYRCAVVAKLPLGGVTRPGPPFQGFLSEGRGAGAGQRPRLT